MFVDEVVTAGRVYFTVQWYSNGGWHNLPSFQFDLCTLTQCPINQKNIQYSTTISVPSFTPSVRKQQRTHTSSSCSRFFEQQL
jgi:hypothetical protein